MFDTPKITEVQLSKAYPFMCENFIIATQHDLFLFLEKSSDVVDALKFRFSIFKYGAPNDEARGGHPLAKFGLGPYGLHLVERSPWIKELMVANRIHPRHSDAMYSDRKHYVACFKDITLDIVCTGMQEVQLSASEIAALVSLQVEYLES